MMRSHPGVEWLTNWIREQLAEDRARLVMLPGVDAPAIHLHGSIGYETAITATGEVWVSAYELDGPAAFQSRWRLAGPKERIGYLVIGARRHPELGRMLPARPGDARNCASCEGTGATTLRGTDGAKVVLVPGMICDECAGLGWLAG